MATRMRAGAPDDGARAPRPMFTGHAAAIVGVCLRGGQPNIFQTIIARHASAAWGPRRPPHRCGWYYIDPNAMAFNFFAQNFEDQIWQEKRLWCFPPPHLAGAMFQHLLHHGKDATVLLPVWPAQAWWATLMCGISDLPIILDPGQDHFEMVHGPIHGEIPRLKNRWFWIAANFCADDSICSAFQKQLRRTCSQTSGQKAAKRAMTFTGNYSQSSRANKDCVTRILTRLCL